MKRIEMKVNHVKHNTENYIADYLGTLGIKPEDVDSFIKEPRESDQDNPWLLDNMKQAVETAYNKLKDGANVFIQVDFPDPEVPIIATNSPFSIENDTPFKALKLSSPVV